MVFRGSSRLTAGCGSGLMSGSIGFFSPPGLEVWCCFVLSLLDFVFSMIIYVNCVYCLEGVNSIWPGNSTVRQTGKKFLSKLL